MFFFFIRPTILWGVWHTATTVTELLPGLFNLFVYISSTDVTAIGVCTTQYWLYIHILVIKLDRERIDYFGSPKPKYP